MHLPLRAEGARAVGVPQRLALKQASSVDQTDQSTVHLFLGLRG